MVKHRRKRLPSNLNIAKRIIRDLGMKVRTTKIPHFNVSRGTYIMVFKSDKSAKKAMSKLRRENFLVFNKKKNTFWIDPKA